MAVILTQKNLSIREFRRRETVSKFRKRKLCESTAKEEGEKGETTPAKLVSRRIVELDLLSKELDSGCQTCGNLWKPVEAVKLCPGNGSCLGSYLYISCTDRDCGEINLCHTNIMHKINDNSGHGRNVFDVNTKLAAG